MTTRILVVCTANVCRSPMAEALLRAQGDRKQVPLVVSSAGIRSVRLPVDPDAVEVMAEVGLEIAHHRPRVITQDILLSERPDLVLTMSRVELRHLVALDRALWARTFTLKEAVRRASLQAGSNPASFDEWLSTLGEGRKASTMMEPNNDDDIPDPYGLGTPVVRRTAHKLDALTSHLMGLAPWR